MRNVIAIVGKAGSGKNTIVDQLVKTYPDKFHRVISHTTRPRRENEKNNQDYIFVSEEYFKRKLHNCRMLEWTRFNNWKYGTSIDSYVYDKINVGIFNPEGIDQLLMHDDIKLKVIYITCSDRIRLIRQLNRELDPDIEEIIRRYRTDKSDFDLFEKKYIIPLRRNFMAIENESRDMIPKIVDIINNL